MTFAVEMKHTNHLLSRIAEQLPEDVRTKLTISILTDPFNLRIKVRFKLPNGMMRDAEVDMDNPVIDQETMGFLSLLTP